ncbi:uncharacterized protein LOC128184911 [Crassostrea angulata]|uniref:uncharacterized protein LOC128184911 n=1 Tax=Magallana angulata TaxID=2784310 RepID=UPI0022B16D7C|nr:uncharacterized protein LOC128184911 [Crassostrea angulata]
MLEYALTTLLIVQSIQEQSLSSSKEICGEENGSIKCCTGYYSEDGICKQCFGAIGPNCSIPCKCNFFGRLCKNPCDCQNNETCDRYFGCRFVDEMDSSTECHNTMLLLVIGSGSAMLSLALLFVGVMIYRWHTILRRNLHPTNTPRGNFKENSFLKVLLPFYGKHEVFQENYDDIRESRMLLGDKGNYNREITENRLSSMDYNHLFLKGRKSISEIPEQYYSAIDARFRSKMPLVTTSEFPEDDCYVSVSQLARQNKRISKSCSDLKIDMSDTHHDIYSNQCRKAKGGTNNRTILIEHL